METKKEYQIGDTVWIFGIDPDTNKLKKGTIVHIFNVDYNQYDKLINYYVIEIPSSIEPLLEIRTWETISQSENGPIGGFRKAITDHAENKILSHLGVIPPRVKSSKPFKRKK